MGTGLRKVINSLISAVKNIDSKNSVLNKLGIKKEEIVDVNGNLKSLSDVMTVLQNHTDSMDRTTKGAIFNSLFGTTGQQAGMILAESSQRLGELTQKTQEAADKGKYVQTLAEKNSQTAQANTEKFKKAWEDLEIKFGAELLPYMTEASKSLSELFSQKDFQESVETAAKDIGWVAKLMVRVGETAAKYNYVLIDSAKLIAKLWVVDKVVNFTLKLKKLAEVFGGFSSKIAKEQAEVSALTAEYQQLAEAKTLASNSYTGDSVATNTSKTTEVAEDLAQATGKSQVSKGAGTKVAKGIETEIANSGAVANGLGKSVEAAGKSVQLASKVVKVGAGLASVASAGFSLWNVGKDITKAIKTGSESATVKAATNVAGTAIGAGIGLYVGGPMGAAIGASIGQTIGSSATVQKITKSTIKAVKKANADLAKQGYVVTADNMVVKVKNAKTDKSSLSRVQKSIIRDLNKTMDKADLAVLQMSVKLDSKSLAKSKKELEDFYHSILKTAQEQSEKRAAAEKKAVEALYKQHRISKQQYEEYLKSIDSANKKRIKDNKRTYDSLIKETNQYNKDLKKATANGEADLNQIAYTYKKKRKELAKQEANEIRGAREAGYVQIGKKTYYGEEAVRKIQEQYKKKRVNLAKQEKKEQTSVTQSTAKEKAKITEKYNKERLKQIKSLSKSIAKEMSASSKQQKEILEKLRADKGKISNKEAKDLINKSADEANKIIDNAEKTRKRTVKEAEKNYQEKKAQYQKMHKDIPGYTKDMMQQDIDNARSERDLTIAAAKEAKAKIVSSARSKHDQVVREAEKQNSSVSKNIVAEGNNGIKSYNKWGAAIHNTLKFLANAWHSIVKAFGGSYNANVDGYAPASYIQANANGGVAKSGPSLVGEAGPELVYTPWAKSVRIVGQRGAEITQLRQGEQILNARDTAKVLAGNYNGRLPGYANGTDFSLGGLLSGLKDKVLDIAENILDTLKTPVEWINKGFKNWTSVQAFDFTSSSLMDDTRELAKKSLLKPVTDAFSKLAKGYEESGAANPGGAGVERWRPYVKKALAKLGLSTSEAMVAKVLRQINTESGGNPHAIQGVYDINSITGNLARGLMQVIPPTFKAYALPGHTNIMNDYDNILAGLNYAKHRYGPNLSALGHGHGYANGGLISKHGLYEVGENNLPEMVIPLDLSKRSRAYQLMQQSLDYFAKNDIASQNSIVTHKAESLKGIEKKMDTMIDIFGQMIGLTVQQTKAIRESAFDKKSLYRQQALDQKLMDFQSF
ncbi:transglycosylase SLT domain-containing protein [Ligilactobacillus agilis]|uniref:transglycosylase SLT domain-containing protein n=1 Tax=Ligilactobacillus agilis TaxID=1601 RepID=UPI00191E8184|nr:transglycosylase SLT domain-containing protein [Ligilactobacillus agilis]MBL1056958.1 transglycosylase SLT domain-containing protein [Ligilactobacillus agilis]